MTRISKQIFTSRWQHVLVLLCLLASTFQGYVAQTHIHAAGVPTVRAAWAGGSTTDAGAIDVDAARGLAAADSRAAIDSQNGGTDGRERNSHSRGENPAACPFCQAVAQGGTALASVFTVLATLSQSGLVLLVLAVFTGCIAAVSYSWQGRGPPRR